MVGHNRYRSCQRHPTPKLTQVNPRFIKSGSRAIWVQWTDWFEGLTITLEEDGDTLLTGPVVDQAALYGLLKKVRDLGLPLVSVNPVNRPRLSGWKLHHKSIQQKGVLKE